MEAKYGRGPLRNFLRIVLGCLFVVVGAAACGISATPAGAAEERRVANQQPPPWARALYEANCAICHGSEGDGNGQMAHMFVVGPRDFRRGIFKFRSTPSGSLPTDEDLLRTLTDGIRWTGMLGRPDLSESDRRALVAYLKTFSPRFAAEKPFPPITVPAPPVRSSELLAQGEKLYREADCVSCHGGKGRGDGPSARGMKDDWGRPTQPSDLTWRPLKRGLALNSLYLTIAAGLSGTPMPSYADALSGNQIWSLVYYLESLVPPERRLSPRQLLGEEQQGQMALRMGGMMGRGMMRGGR